MTWREPYWQNQDFRVEFDRLGQATVAARTEDAKKWLRAMKLIFQYTADRVTYAPKCLSVAKLEEIDRLFGSGEFGNIPAFQKVDGGAEVNY